MRLLLLLSATLWGASAFPTVKDMMSKRAAPGTPGAKRLSKLETNCGPIPCTTFNEKEQLISVSGKHKFVAPKASDLRGPCPGLNAASNHGYLPHNGLLQIDDTIFGLEKAYSFGNEFAAALAVFSIVMVGDVATQTWSIGGPQPYPDLGGLLSPPQGISYSHNKYEGDVSIGRDDAYMNDGDAHTLNLVRFKRAYEVGMNNDRYTLHKFRKAFGKNVGWSIKNNPYYFSPPFAGTIVAPAAYNFVINFMSNRTKEEPSGYLDGYNFKQFFAVTGDYPNFSYKKGWERIPRDWYKRPLDNRYDAAKTAEDDVIGWGAFPQYFKIGGNTNGTNTYKGVDLSLLTGGQFNDGNILEGNNLACLAFQGQQQVLPDELKGGVNEVTAALALFDQFVGPVIAGFGCAPLKKYDATLFNEFPGRHYNPKGGSTDT